MKEIMCNSKTSKALSDVRKKLKKYRPEVCFYFEECSNTMKLTFENMNNSKISIKRCGKTPSCRNFAIYLKRDVNTALIEIESKPFDDDNESFSIGYYR